MTAKELSTSVLAPPMPDFHVRQLPGEVYVAQPLTHNGRVYLDKAKAMGCSYLGDRIVLDGLTELVALCDSLFDEGLRVC
jgi:hypothetical protein